MSIRKLSVIVAGVSAMTMSAWETPTMGWSSWNAFGHQINEQIIKSQADAMISTGLYDAGYKYINIDDGAWCGRDGEGHLVIHPTRFPNGLKTLVDYIHSLGLKAGTYSDAGYNTCASYWGGDKDGIGTGLYEHDADDINFMFNDLGFDFIKVDFCGGAPEHNTDRLDLDERERYTAIGNAIKATGRDDVRYNICRWAYPGTWVEDVATSWRMSQDIYLGWESVKDIIHQNLYLSAYARHGKFNDMDMLEIGRGLTVEEDKTHMGMWCMMSSPLLIGCDLRSIDETSRALLSNSELIALNQDPLALQAVVAKREGETYVLVKDVETLYGTTRAVAFYNPGDLQATIGIDFFDIDLKGPVKVRDLFEGQDLGAYDTNFSVSVPPHGTRIYRFEATSRLEQKVYEAETGRIEAYQELENNQVAVSGVYEEMDACSGGAKASWLGNRNDNSLSWNNVYSFDGGDYVMTIYFISGADREIVVEVNGQPAAALTVNSGAWDKIASVDLNVKLNKGDNTVTLMSENDWMPDIDCMIIVKEGDIDIYRHRHQSALAAVKEIDLSSLPVSLQGYFTGQTDALSAPEDTKDGYESATASLADLKNEIMQAVANYAEYESLLAVAEKNAAASDDSQSLTEFLSAIDECKASMAVVTEPSAITGITSGLVSAMKVFLTAADTSVKEGMSLNADILIVNGKFNNTTDGWSGNPVWGCQAAEHWNKAFATYQTVTGLKNGYYTVSVKALYRRAANDGGTLFRSGSEVINARFVANESECPVMSLYQHPLSGYPELGALLSGTHVLNGYVNSMYGASMAFAEGLYLNELEVKVTDGSLKIGLECATSVYDCWCCFDDFCLTYHGNEPAGVDITEADSEEAIAVYNTQGVYVGTYDAQGISALPKGLYVAKDRKIVVR